jgi:hypothetical protein
VRVSTQWASWLRLMPGAAGRILRRRAWWALLAAVMFSAGAWWALAQRELPRIESRFSFARIRFTSFTNFGGFGRRGRGGGYQPWAHDFPASEENFMKILAEVTKIDANPGGHIISFENEEVFKYPIAYLCEVGFMNLTAKEMENMREYLLRGGFLIVDDFRGDQELNNFIYQMKMVFPDRSLEELPRSHPIFTCFYDISSLQLPPPYSQYLTPVYLGMKDDDGRLMMVVDYNNDISDYWEWSANPLQSIENTNEAFKYGVNYVMYALTH